jgi:hypothetical protein
MPRLFSSNCFLNKPHKLSLRPCPEAGYRCVSAQTVTAPSIFLHGVPLCLTRGRKNLSKERLANGSNLLLIYAAQNQNARRKILLIHVCSMNCTGHKTDLVKGFFLPVSDVTASVRGRFGAGPWLLSGGAT